MTPSVGVRPHILIADADADTRSMYRGALDDPATIDEAADGADVITKAILQPPTLVITELRHPHVDGYAICTTLRAQVTTRDTRILVVTASGFETPIGAPPPRLPTVSCGSRAPSITGSQRLSPHGHQLAPK
jgi:CheY-like chemotaxis protein